VPHVARREKDSVEDIHLGNNVLDEIRIIHSGNTCFSFKKLLLSFISKCF
jgi:hypothetical protein